MKEKVFALLLMAGLPFAVMAQSNDDLYFVPKKEKKVEKTTVVSTSSKEITKLPEPFPTARKPWTGCEPTALILSSPIFGCRKWMDWSCPGSSRNPIRPPW